jgi:hypothetical protein
MKKFLPVIGIIFFTLFVNSAQAQQILSCNASGSEVNTFYTNDTVYVTSTGNITADNQTVDIYVIYDDYWIYTTLTDVSSEGKETITTNATGYMNVTKIWSPTLAVGKYDIVIDVNRNGMYDSGVDLVDNTTITGFEVLAIPVPSLSVELGPNSPLNHNWNLGNDSYNTMLQLKLTAGSVEDVKINSIALSAGGTGDDKNGISVVYLFLDENGNGIYDEGENWLSFGRYNRDNGVLMFNIENGYVISQQQTVYMLVAYKMSNSSSNGDTYNFQIASISVAGATSGNQITPTGLPIASATKTIVAESTTTTTSTTTSTTTLPTTTTTTLSLTEKITEKIKLPDLGPNWIYIVLAAGLIPVAIIAIILLIAFLRRRQKPQSEFEELKQKWEKK